MTIDLPSMKSGTLDESVTSNCEVDAADRSGVGSEQVAPSSIAEAKQLPTLSTKAYFAAKLQVPELVTRETPESRFLAAENGNIARAAQRLASYWESRVELFGEQRAFLPMDQTGKGALSPRDVEMLRRLPFTNAPCDKQGRPIVACFYQHYTADDNHSSHSLTRLRVCFYTLAVASEQPTAQSKGFVMMASIVGNFKPPTIRRLSDLIRHSLPFRCVEIHCLILPSNLTFAGRIVWNVVDIFYNWMLAQTDHQIVVHRGNTDTETVDDLKEYGITPSVIPTWLGGTWTRKACLERHDRRLEVERKRAMSADEKANERRRLEVERGRQRRRNRQIEEVELDRSKTHLEQQNHILRQEGKRLEALLSLARSQILPISGSL